MTVRETWDEHRGGSDPSQSEESAFYSGFALGFMEAIDMCKLPLHECESRRKELEAELKSAKFNP